jgi:acyl carrier protein
MTSTMPDSVQSEIRTFVIENFMFGQGAQLKDSESLLEAGLIDSTGVLELVGFLETKFAIAVADEDLVPANLDSVERAARFVERKLKNLGPRIVG